MAQELNNLISKYQPSFHPVVQFDPDHDCLLALDFTAANTTLTNEIIENTVVFADYIRTGMKAAHARYGIGGYAEHRTVYSRSGVFDADASGEEPRRLHLGVDIWAPEGTAVFAPLDGRIHSYAFNDHYGDYGATIILLHELEDVRFHTLYGHLSLRDIENVKEGALVKRGDEFAHVGSIYENGYWPPHLHLQVIDKLGDAYGDYLGVCKFSERDQYLANCPDPDLIININRWIKSANTE